MVTKWVEPSPGNLGKGLAWIRDTKNSEDAERGLVRRPSTSLQKARKEIDWFERNPAVSQAQGNLIQA